MEWFFMSLKYFTLLLWGIIKYTKKMRAFTGAIILVAILFINMPLYTMFAEKTTARQKQLLERYKNELIWVRTSDNVRMEVPRWQINQMKVLEHKGKGTQYHWVNAPMVESNELAFVHDALNVFDTLHKMKDYYADFSQNQRDRIINSASKLEMQNLTFLLMAYTFPMNVQSKIGASIAQIDNVTVPVVKHVQEKRTKVRSLEEWFALLDSVTRPGVKNVPEEATDLNVPIEFCAQIKGLVYNPDRNDMVAGAYDQKLIVWNKKMGDQIKIFEGHKSEVQCVACSPDSNYIVSGAADGNLILWDSKTDKQIKTLIGHTACVRCVAYSPDSSYIVSGSNDKMVIVWDGNTGKQITILKGHENAVRYVGYSVDGKYIVSVGTDSDVIVWSSETGERIKITYGQNVLPIVECVTYSPDLNYIVEGSCDGDLSLWNRETGERVKIFKGSKSHRGFMPYEVYSADRHYKLFRAVDGEMILCKGGYQIKILKQYGYFVDYVTYDSAHRK